MEGEKAKKQSFEKNKKVSNDIRKKNLRKKKRLVMSLALTKAHKSTRGDDKKKEAVFCEKQKKNMEREK